MQKYHDEEWGIPKRDGRRLFEDLVLDGAQAGLSWITILRKRQKSNSAINNAKALLKVQEELGSFDKKYIWGVCRC